MLARVAVLGVVLGAGLATALAPVAASAQAGLPGNALGEARSRMVCGAGTLVSAQYIGGGMMRVTCRQEDQKQDKKQKQNNAQSQTQNPLAQGLSTPAAVGSVVVLTVTAILLGDDGTSTTTSSRSSSGLGMR